MSTNNKIDVDKAIKEVEEIVAWFQKSEIKLDEALTKYRQGLKKIRAIEDYLQRAKIEVEKIDKEFSSE